MKKISLLFDFSLIFLIAFSLRLVYFFQVTKIPYLTLPTGDAERYLEWGKQIAQGDWIGRGVFFQAPGYPYFVGFLFCIFGVHLKTVYIVQHILSSITAGLVYLIGRLLFDRRCAIISGLIFALYGYVIFYGNFLQKPTFELFIFCCALLFLALQTDKINLTFSFLSGIFFALATLIHENLLFVGFIALTWLFWHASRQLKYHRWYLAVICFVVGIVSGLMPLAVRNYVVSKEFIILTSQGGAVLYMGNSPKATGAYVSLGPGDANVEAESRYAKEIAEKELGRSLNANDASNYWVQKVLEFIKSQPYRFIQLMLRKFYLFWNNYEIPDTESFYFYQRFSSFLHWVPIRFGFISVFGLIGLVLSFRRRRVLFLHFVILSIFCITVTFFVFSRYRLPVVIPLSVLASYALTYLFDAIRSKQVTHFLIFLVVTVLLTIVITGPLPLHAMKEREISTALYNLGIVYRRDKKYDEGQLLFEHAVQVYPDNDLAQNILMKLDFNSKKFNQAEQRAEEILKKDPNHLDALKILGLVSWRQGNLEKAQKAFDHYLKIDPKDETVKNYLDEMKRNGGKFFEDDKVPSLSEEEARALNEEIEFLEGIKKITDTVKIVKALKY